MPQRHWVTLLLLCILLWQNPFIVYHDWADPATARAQLWLPFAEQVVLIMMSM